MPIYCLNNAKTARKKSQNIVQDILGCDNYYLTGKPQNLSAASNQILQNKRRQQEQNRSIENCPLMIHIENFQNSVKNMRETVLVPMRLNDCADNVLEVGAGHPSSTTPGLTLITTPTPPEVFIDPLASDGVSCCSSLSEQSSLEAHSTSVLSDVSSIVSCSSSLTSLEASINQHSTFEQFKLLNLIDSLLDADNPATLQSQYRTLNKSGNHSQTCALSYPIENIHGRSSIGSTSAVNSSVISDDDEGIASPGDTGDSTSTSSSSSSSSSDTPPTSCALIKLKDKFQHHLVHLKSILQLMTNCSETLTQKYLEDIQCDDHFDSESPILLMGNSSGFSTGSLSASSVNNSSSNNNNTNSSQASSGGGGGGDLRDHSQSQRQYFTSSQHLTIDH